MAVKTCIGCSYWRTAGTTSAGDEYGCCHRYPPTNANSSTDLSNYANTLTTDFCGEWVDLVASGELP